MKIVPHYEMVNLANIRAEFFSDMQHRATLHIPFAERAGDRTLCIIGQNPSNADERNADKTVNFLERYVFEKLPKYSQILMLNLYSRIDTKKSETSELNHSYCEYLLQEAICKHQDFLVVFGALKNQGAYCFPSRVNDILPLFDGKNVFKFDIGTNYAPHPGNPKILYCNLNIKLARYDFSDVKLS
jgi:hypothetical protein